MKSAVLREHEIQHVRLLGSWARRAFLRRLDALRDCHIVWTDPDGTTTFGSADAPAERTAAVTVHDAAFYGRVVRGGHNAAAEAYFEKLWDVDNLTALVRAFVANRDVMNGMERGAARLVQPLLRAAHTLRRNTRRGAKRNIAAHYDIGNDFFRLVLDESMTYSCALFEDARESLAEAQRNKNDRVGDALQIGKDDHVLEIGTGWGGFAIHAAQRHGCRVTTTTISEQQLHLAKARVEAAGLSDRVTVLLRDYRDLSGTYDKIVSIEMIEAVGHRYYATFFETCEQLLRRDGAMLLQSITVRDRYFDECKNDVDFIKKFIFPGSCIPSVTVLMQAAAKRTDLAPTQVFDLTPSYGETLRRWRRNFHTHIEAIRALGYNELFLRMWEFYLAYCEGGFDERFIGTQHLVWERPESSLAGRLR